MAPMKVPWICLGVIVVLAFPYSGWAQEPEEPAQWASWSQWHCDQGYVWERDRDCEGEGPCNCTGEGRPCEEGKETGLDQNYFPLKCPVSPEPAFWESWQEWSACSVSCGGGNRFRVRNCTYPGGDSPACEGMGFDEESSCNPHECPVHGEYIPWGDWGPCSKTCGEAVQSRSRECSPPRHGGEVCSGENKTEIRLCDDIVCPGWSAWKPWSACTFTCGEEGRKRRERECMAGADILNNENCTGGNESSYQLSTCNRRPCPIDGDWGPWSQWICYQEACSGQRGVRQRRRRCDSPQPQHGGEYCEGASFERVTNCTKPCYREVDGGWCAWFTPPCEVKGEKVHEKRWCNCPPPQNGGEKCKNSNGDTAETGIESRETAEICTKVYSGSGSGSGDGSAGEDDEDDDGGEGGSADNPDDRD